MHVFLQLYNEQCLYRLKTPDHIGIHTPFYILNTPCLRERRYNALNEIMKHRIVDSTFVFCADAAILKKMNTTLLHPGLVQTKWSKAGSFLKTGTLSLALKHMIAAYDIYIRGLSYAVVMEDDAIYVDNFQMELEYIIKNTPKDANIFHLGSYSRINQRFNSYPIYTGSIHIRKNSSWIVGATSYILFRKSCLDLIHPVIAPADISFSLQQFPIYAPEPTYGGTHFQSWPNASLKGGSHTITQKCDIDEFFAKIRYGHGFL